MGRPWRPFERDQCGNPRLYPPMVGTTTDDKAVHCGVSEARVSRDAAALLPPAGKLDSLFDNFVGYLANAYSSRRPCESIQLTEPHLGMGPETNANFKVGFIIVKIKMAYR